VWPAKHLREFARNSAAEVMDITHRAFSCGDDLGAALILTALDGVAMPAATALLMAHDPDHYTIADQRAWKSLTSKGEIDNSKLSWRKRWIPYLEVCRRV
jgi:hypothetical protein